MSSIRKPESLSLNQSPKNGENRVEGPDFVMSRRKIIGLFILGGLGLASGISGKTEAQWRDAPGFEKEPTWTREQMDSLFSNAELMRPKEVNRMQRAQEAIFRAYLNPPLIMYLKNKSNLSGSDEINLQKADAAMEAVMEHPFDVKYVRGDNGVITVMKKPGDKVFADDFSDSIIKIDGSGHLIEINGIEIPVFSQDEYDRLAREFDIHQFKDSLEAQRSKNEEEAKERNYQIDDIIKKFIFKRSLKRIPERLKRLYEVNNIILPQRLAKCVAIRNTAYKLDTPDDYSKFTETVPLNAADFNDLASDYPAKKRIWLELDKKYPGVYIFHFKYDPSAKTADSQETANSPAKAKTRETIVVTREGYILPTREKTINKLDSNNRPVTEKRIIPTSSTNPAYKDRIKKLYYESFPAAAELTDND